MKMNMSILLATSLIASGYAFAHAGAWQVPSWDARLTESGAVQGMTGETWCGHVQGMCATSNALYFAFHNQILKTDWCGRFLKRVKVEVHTGDICWWNGHLYTVVSVGGRRPQPKGETKITGAIQEFDEDLTFIREVTWTGHGGDGITCLDGVIYVGMSAVSKPAIPRRGFWIGKYDARTLEPLCRPFAVDPGYEHVCGPQNITTDGTNIYVALYSPDETAKTPCFITFDKDFNVKASHLFGWRQGVDVVPGGKNGAVRFIYCTTINWIGGKKRLPRVPVQALLQFAELKDGKIEDITRHCVFSKPIDR